MDQRIRDGWAPRLDARVSIDLFDSRLCRTLTVALLGEDETEPDAQRAPGSRIESRVSRGSNQSRGGRLRSRGWIRCNPWWWI